MKHLRHYHAPVRRILALIALALLATSETRLHAAEGTSTVERVLIKPAPMPLNANIHPRYPIERASWVWHPAFAVGQNAVLQFRNEFEVKQATEILIHVSADQRYQLSLDGKLMSLGPDRSDLAHWSFASYRVKLQPGKHSFEALVAWIGDSAPTAQITHRGGFVFACEGALGARLNTGRGAWMTRTVKGWSFAPPRPTRAIGYEQTIDGLAQFDGSEAWVRAAEIVPPLKGTPFGLMRTDWSLHPSPLPDQKLTPTSVGVVRAIAEGPGAGESPVSAEEIARATQAADWTQLLVGRGAVKIDANRTVAVLIDLQNYYAAYPRLRLSGGRGSRVSVGWAEALFEPSLKGERVRIKGHRDEIAGKVFFGISDHFLTDGGQARDYSTWWWRAGRYVRLTVTTADEPLILDKFDLLETRYPLEDESRFVTSDPGLDAIQPMLVRGMQMCAHETYMDCPYYEQLMYVGDTRLEMLTTYVMTPDTRLPRRSLELFDWSRNRWGLVAEHFPGRNPQLSPTFSLIWVSMVRDFAYWQNDPAFVRGRLVSVRGVLEQMLALRGPSGLLEQLPGWPFVDWVPGWTTGNAPNGVEGISSVNNLFLVQALRDAGDLEEAFGEPILAQRNRALARQIADEIVRRFWVPERGLLADDEAHKNFSEHAQCLALLNDVLAPAQRAQCFQSLLTTGDLHRATVYFSFYLLEVFKQFDRGDLLVERLDFWRDLVRLGLKTPVEQPEPSRSDCHAWGSHPLFHNHASLFGVRPTSPGFRTLEIAPSPGPLRTLDVRVPHPSGWIEGKLEFSGDRCSGEITMPSGTSGVFRWRGTETPLTGGQANVIR